MKKTFLSLGIILISLSICIQAYAQKNHIEKMILKEKQVLEDTTILTFNGQSYIYNKKDEVVISTKVITPKDLGKHAAKDHCCRIENYSQLDSIYNITFSKDRMLELKDSKLYIYCILNRHGSVKKMVFFLTKSPDITLKEINTLETAILNFKFELTGTIEEQQHYYFLLQCRFNELLNKQNSN